MPKITYISTSGEENTVEASVGMTVMRAAIANAVPGIDADCGGSCACATCHVYVDPEWTAKLPAVMSDERELLAALAQREPNSRLSCQIEFTDALAGLRVTIAPDE